MVLEETALDKVSYTFGVWQTALPGDEDDLLYQFEALVPSSLTPINFSDLAQQSGLRYDQQDASLLTLANYVLNNPIFANRLADKLFNMRGVYSSTTLYKKGDSVIYDGDGYIYVNDFSYSSKVPTDASFWKQYVAKGTAGSGTAGDNSTYSAAWNNSTVAPSRNAVYQRMEQLLTIALASSTYALKVDGVLTRPLSDSTQPLANNDNSFRLANTAWVQALLAPSVNQIPVGGRVKWDVGQALPVKYIRADGAAVSRTTYPSLFTIYGTTYGAGNGTTTFNVMNDPGFIIYIG
jgi:hypothetical protein